MQVRARQGDTLDLICHRHLGTTAGVTERALELNPGIAALGAELPIGAPVTLPEAPDAPVKTRTKLWD